MKEPKTNAEVANWCIVNALKLPNELVVSIATKLMQNIPEQERTEVMQRAGWLDNDCCLICRDTTKVKFNINFKAVAICESCDTNVFIQQAQWYVHQPKLTQKKLKKF